MPKFIEHQNWRYATKKFDTNKKINPEDLELLKEGIRLSTSSYGLQPYKVIIVENNDVREQIKPHAWGQSQITEASHLLVFANKLNFGDAEIDIYGKNVIETRNIPRENIAGYLEFIKSKIGELSITEKNNWTAKQTYLALGNLINIAAELKIDVTPMEGFLPEKVNNILDLDKQNLNATLLATLGYRHENDETQHYQKVRKSKEELFITI
jgi:nitroreductase